MFDDEHTMVSRPLKAIEECCIAQIIKVCSVITEQLLLCKSDCWVPYDQTPLSSKNLLYSTIYSFACGINLTS